MHPELSRRLVQAQLKEALTTEGLFSENVELVEFSYPRLYVRFRNADGQNRLIRFECSNYDFQPIAIEPVDPQTRELLPPHPWMRRGGGDFPAHPMHGNRPFLCLAGTRDYYLYEGHAPKITGERWEKLRPDLTLRDLIRTLSDRFREGTWR